MGHFARVDDQGKVEVVLVVANAAMNDLDFPESEPLGRAVLAESGHPGTFYQCSYNASFRGCYPGEGYTYDEKLDAFLPPVGSG